MLFNMLLNPGIEVHSWLPVNDDVCYVGWTQRQEAYVSTWLTSVVVAAFTTAQARLKLFSYLGPLVRRCLYLDTDSILFYSRGTPGEYEPELGPMPGQMVDELTAFSTGSRIVEFVSGGPKFYAFEVLRPSGEVVYVIKVKGIRLCYQTASLVNFRSVRDMIRGATEPVVVRSSGLRRTPYHEVVSLAETKVCRPVYAKRRFVGPDESYPFGYKSP